MLTILLGQGPGDTTSFWAPRGTPQVDPFPPTPPWPKGGEDLKSWADSGWGRGGTADTTTQASQTQPLWGP